jgi:hypothetical protein
MTIDLIFPAREPDALTLSVAWQLAKDGGYTYWQDMVEEAERILELEGEPIEFPFQGDAQPASMSAQFVGGPR